MTKVSRLQLDPKQLSFFLNNFWNLLTLLDNKEQVKIFFKELFTHTEMKMLVKRIQIAKMLIEGYSYRDIRNHVKVTDPTIAKISNILAVDGEGLKTAVRQLQKMEREIDKKHMQAMPDLKDRYGMYFLPEKLINAANTTLKKRKKRISIKRSLPT